MCKGIGSLRRDSLLWFFIGQALERHMKFKDIALLIEKDPTTVSKEICRHRIAKESERKTALCENRSICTKKHMCRQSNCNKFCGKCILHYGQSYCKDYSAPVCRRLRLFLSCKIVCRKVALRIVRHVLTRLRLLHVIVREQMPVYVE